MSAPDAAEQHSRQAAHDLLVDKLWAGTPMRPEVQRALADVLAALSISEDPMYRPESPGLDERLRADQSIGWRVAVEKYRALLAEVRENGASV